MDKFIVHSQDEQAQMLAMKLPQGEFWDAKDNPNSNLYKLLLGLGFKLMRLEADLNYAADELSLIRTNDLIDEWEKEYAIGASCFASLSDGADLETRINNILILISADGTSTEEQFEAIALALGLVVDVRPGGEYSAFPLTFTHTFLGDQREIRFTIIVDMENVPVGAFTYEFPFTFSDPVVGALKCLFNRLKPANCRVVYVNEGGTGGSIVGGFSDGFDSGFEI
jgi:uncharacterized protein YmfQ (DUF2313 family)